ncbi:MAG: hypothetical protein A2Y14_03720 [Verrucomicrobia bacterium GWF2_51_19]|nr:MAG: hypothetical protein A2Y14_03720 [Verrucomicrobia bacterium GWF2_51_19]HCJ12585.1 hypothetical protein [Opitutae bacterium]
MLTHPLLKVDTQYPKGAGPALPLRQIVLAQSQILTAFFTGLCELTTYEMKRPLKNGSYSKTRVGELQLEALLQQS